MASSSETETRLRITATNQSGEAFRGAARDAQRMARDVENSMSRLNRTMEQFSGSVLGMRRALGAASGAFVLGEQIRDSITQFAELDRRMMRLGRNATTDANVSMQEQIKINEEGRRQIVRIAQQTAQDVNSVTKGAEAFVRTGA